MAEEKFADRPQILKGDIVRVETEDKQSTTCYFVQRDHGDKQYGEWINLGPYAYTSDKEVVAIYRFDGRDFKCIWESLEYKLDRFEKAVAEVSTSIKNLQASVTSVAAAVRKMDGHAKETKGKTSE